MKSIGYTLGVCAIIGAGCNRTPSKPSQATLPFEYTNIVHQLSAFVKEPTLETIINFTNLVFFGHQTEKITMGLGAQDYEISVFFDSTNHTVRKIIQQTTVGTNHFWLIDSNGDGIPDERRKFGQREPEVLLRGEWRPTRGPYSNRQALVNSNWLSIRFQNDRWQPLQ